MGHFPLPCHPCLPSESTGCASMSFRTFTHVLHIQSLILVNFLLVVGTYFWGKRNKYNPKFSISFPLGVEKWRPLFFFSKTIVTPSTHLQTSPTPLRKGAHGWLRYKILHWKQIPKGRWIWTCLQVSINILKRRMRIRANLRLVAV